MSVEIEYFYDLGSPNCYLANAALKSLVEKHGCKIVYKPFLLGAVFKATNNQPPLMAFANVKPKIDYMMTEIKRYMKKHNLPKFRMNPHFPLHSLMMMRASIAAEEIGKLDEFINTAEKLIWEEGVQFDDPDTFVSVMTEAGFDGAALLAKAQDQYIKDKLAANTQNAIDRGAFGAPTFYIENAMFFGKDSLGPMEDEILSRV